MEEIFNLIRKKKEAFTAAAAVILLYTGMDAVGIGCPIKFVTGISCAGCGMTRAWLALLKGNVQLAYYYHPLFFLPPIALVILLLRKKICKTIFNSLIFIIAVLFVIVYILRMLHGDGDIVVFGPQNGLIGRIVLRLITWR